MAETLAEPQADVGNENVEELKQSLADIQGTLSRFVVEAPQAVLMDCYAAEYTAAITKV